MCQTCFAGFLGNARLSKIRCIVHWLKFTCSDPQDVPYNPTEQGQVGQLSNRYIVISRLIRYELLFISCSCVTISCKIVLKHVRHSRIILLPRTGKSLVRRTCVIVPARIALYEHVSDQTTEMQRVIMSSLPQRIARNRR